MKKILPLLALLLVSFPAWADRYAIIDQSGHVANIVEYDAQPASPPAGFASGYAAVPLNGSSASPGWTYSGGVFTDPNPPPAPSAAQLAQSTYAAAINAGLAIASTGTPAINATYAIDAAAQADVTAIASSIGAGMGLPGGGTTLQWADKSGALHTLTQAQFLAIAVAERDYVYQLHIAAQQAAAGGSPTWPSATITIP